MHIYIYIYILYNERSENSKVGKVTKKIETHNSYQINNEEASKVAGILDLYVHLLFIFLYTHINNGDFYLK